MSNVLNFEKKSSSEKQQKVSAAREWLKKEAQAEAEFQARPTKAIAGTFNPDLLAGSMARLLLNLGDEINMLGFELMSRSTLFDTERLYTPISEKREHKIYHAHVIHELEQQLYRWDRRLVDLQDRFDLLTDEPVDCYLDAQYPDGMECEQLQSWLEKCTAQLNVYFIEVMPFNTELERQKSLKWIDANQEPEFLTTGEIMRLYLGNYQEPEFKLN